MTHAIHDFARKLRGPAAHETLATYVAWRREVRSAREAGLQEPAPPRRAPISINLDLTTACNFRCTHCIDWDVLNGRERHAAEDLFASLRSMAAEGLASVILIGGGEPTLHPLFLDTVRLLKAELGLAVAIVSNGSRGERLVEAARLMGKGDWIRLSLDSGSNELFRAMHRPNDPQLDLDAICAHAPAIRAAGPEVTLGYSYIVTWEGAQRDDEQIFENIDEIVLAAERAKASGFHYIGFKPVLTRTEDGAEVMDPASMEAHVAEVAARIRTEVERAKELADGEFQVFESINLRLLEQGSWEEATRQPRTCHMQALRQVLSPLGLFNCPAHRGVDKARIGAARAWADGEAGEASRASTAALLDTFDASTECAQVTCLYHSVNWWIEGLVADPDAPLPDALEVEDPFL
ncbi:MAG: radical SAM protein [Planctomycetes bacterium]|nr:radical SAM protein [Planctomycetota bacterium]MDA0947896.1 radical SAM protein [Planctomycetota bacterium]